MLGPGDTTVNRSNAVPAFWSHSSTEAGWWGPAVLGSCPSLCVLFWFWFLFWVGKLLCILSEAQKKSPPHWTNLTPRVWLASEEDNCYAGLVVLIGLGNRTHNDDSFCCCCSFGWLLVFSFFLFLGGGGWGGEAHSSLGLSKETDCWDQRLGAWWGWCSLVLMSTILHTWKRSRGRKWGVQPHCPTHLCIWLIH